MTKKFRILLLLSILTYFSNLNNSSIYILDEAKNAGCAMEMMKREDWIVPTFNTELRTDKPPLHYFFMIVAYKALGVSPFTARLFSGLMGVLLILSCFWFVSKIINPKVGFYSCLVMLSSLQLSIQFHLAVPDPYLILWIALCLLSFFYAVHYDSKFIVLTYAFAGLGFLTKGPIAIVLPGLVAVFYLFLSHKMNWKILRQLMPLRGFLLFLLIVAPWYSMVGFATQGIWLEGFFINHNVNRYTSTMEGHGGFPFASFFIIIGALLPFSTFIFQGIKLAFAKRKEFPLLLFCLLVVATTGLFFSFSRTILPSYPAPAFPFLAILIGFYLYNFEKQFVGTTRSVRVSLFVHTLIACVIPAGILVAFQREESLMHLSKLSFLFLLIPLGSLLGWYFLTIGKPRLFIYTWCTAWMLTSFLFLAIVYPQIDKTNPVTESLPLLTGTYRDRPIIGYKIFNPAYVFNLQHSIPVVWSKEQLDSLALGPKVIVLTRTEYLKDSKDTLWTEVYKKKDLFEKSETMVLSN